MMYLKHMLMGTLFCVSSLCVSSLIVCSTNYDIKTIKNHITECTKLMHSLSQERPTLDNPTWTELFKIIVLLEDCIASNKLPPEILLTIQRSIASITAVYTSQLQIHSHITKNDKQY